MLKWKLMLTTLPWAVGIMLLSLVRAEVLHLGGLVDFADLGAILTATAIVMGFMLSGVMADYKESEKLPAEIAGTLEVIGDLIVATTLRTKDDLTGLKHRFTALLSATQAFLLHVSKADSCYAEMNLIAAAPGVTDNIVLRIDILRRLITRVDVIRRTSFIRTGYALLDILIVVVCFLLVFANFKTLLAQSLIVSGIVLVYIYVVRLIRDLDNPFEYKFDGTPAGATEVELFPVLEAQRRVAPDAPDKK